jgi:predicted ATPase/DNA-binding SARP family transcriptional activator
VRFRDLGPLLVEIDGVEHPAGGRMPEIILSRLLVSLNARVPADALREALVSDRGKLSRTDTLETHIWRLRKLLEPHRRPRQDPAVLINDMGGYRLLVVPEDVDSTRLEQLSAQIQDASVGAQARDVLRLCDQAIALWRGEPFETTAHQDWAAPMVARLEHLYEGIRERRIDALLNSGNLNQALADLEPMLAATPYGEHLWACKMLGLYRLGRVEEALGVFHQARQVLLDELGMDPGPELRDVQQRIQNHDPELLVEPPQDQPVIAVAEARLPPRGGPVIGRDDDVRLLCRLVTERSVVTITGVAGAGKTRLAVEVAQHSQAEFAGDVCFVDLTATDSDDLVAGLISSTLSIEPSPVGTATESIVAFARRRRTLIVLDNCEHVLSGVADIVDALLSHDVQCVVLATSREPLGVSAEVIWTLGPLPVVDLDGPDSSPAVALFRARAKDASPTLTLDGPAERDLVHRICLSVDGLPLAIELAAARVRTNSLTEIAQQVGEDPSRLSRLGRGTDDHRRTIRETIDWSYRLLPAQEQQLHCRLAILPGAFTASAAAGLHRGDSISEDAVADSLAQLVHRSMLVTANEQTARGPTLYAQLATVRGHARTLLSASGEESQVVARRDEWVDRLLDARPRLGYADSTGWHDRVDHDYSAVRASLHRRLVVDPDPSGVAAASKLTMYWRVRASMDEGRRWLELAVDRPGTSTGDRVSVQLGLATALALQRRTDLFRSWLDHTLADAVSLDDATDLIDAGDRLASLAHAVFAVGEDDVVAAVSMSLDDVAALSRDAGHELAAQVVRAAHHPTTLTAEQAEQLHARTLENGNLRAALLCCLVACRRALNERDDSAGAIWVARAVEAHIGMGARQVGSYLETWANFAALRSSYAASVTAHAAARRHLLRSGQHWPRSPLTDADIATARDKLDRAAFDRSWRDGESLDFDAATALIRSAST